MIATGTTNLDACYQGHDWQAVQWAKTGWSVLVVCRRCANARWVGGKGADQHKGQPE